MSKEITLNKGLERLIWLGISSITMGIGISSRCAISASFNFGYTALLFSLIFS